MSDFKLGDLVRIKAGTHQSGIPWHRIGLIVEVHETSKSYTKIYSVLLNEETLRFHEMFLELV